MGILENATEVKRSRFLTGEEHLLLQGFWPWTYSGDAAAAATQLAQGSESTARFRAGNAFSTTVALAATLGSLISCSAWFTIAQRQKLATIPRGITHSSSEDLSLARASQKRRLSSPRGTCPEKSPKTAKTKTDKTEQQGTQHADTPAEQQSSQDTQPANKAEQQQPGGQAHEMQTEADNPGEQNGQDEPTQGSMQHQQAKPQGDQSLEDALSDVVQEFLAQEMQDLEEKGDFLEVFLDGCQERFEEEERKELNRQRKQKREAERGRQQNMLMTAFQLHKLPDDQRQQTLDKFLQPQPEQAELRPANKRELDKQDTPDAPEPPKKMRRIRHKESHPEFNPPKEQQKQPEEEEKDADKEPDEPAKNPAKRVGTGNSRGESISIYKKVQAIKQYESLVKEHGKKIGSQKFYELKLPGLFCTDCTDHIHTYIISIHLRTLHIMYIKKKIQLRQAAPASIFSIIRIFLIRVRNVQRYAYVTYPYAYTYIHICNYTYIYTCIHIR